MSLNGIIGNALSGLQAAQLGMRTASNNVANVNTAGYARTEINQTARNAAGQGMGVEIVGIERVTDRYLQAASLRAGSDASAAEVLASTLDRLQAQFGAPDDEGALFGRLNQAFSSLGSAATDSAERVARLSAASDIQTFFDEAQRLSVEIRGMRDEADQRIAAGVERVNEILAEMQALNSEAQALSASVTDTSGTANRQAELMDELSTYMDVRADYQADGSIFVRTGNGTTLLDNSRLELDYTPAGTGAYGIDYGSITAVVSASGAQVDLTPAIQSGQIRGLMELRDQELPAIAGGLAEFAAGVADGLNAAHNNSSSYPAPNSLEGRQTGLVSSDILTGSGASRLAVVGADGSLVRLVEVQVGAAGFTVDGNAAPLIADLVTQLNTAFAGDAMATFTNGQLTITATNGANGIATVQDEADPSSIGGRGFAHFFGLNDIVDAARPGFFDTGLEPGSFHQLTAGGELGFNVFTPDGRRALEVAVPVTGSTLADQIAALNSPTTGIGQYGSFALDANGHLRFTPAAGYEQYDVNLASDSTLRAASGQSFSQLFGLGDAARMNRSEALQVDPAIRSDSGRLAMARLDLTGASVPGDLILFEGDNRGGQDLAASLTTKRRFEGAGSLAGGMAGLEEFGARLAGDVGSRAARAERAELASQSVKAAADQKRSDVEGVNLDEELARMTLYQQAYNASARLLQASKEMTDTLLSIV
ncbi:flagellar hook-associated protein FlgK [Maricaulaceae bacterium NA33B04]|nr:flagellar hook-associated protein FlgK [Maricaulaceae bacterium NA33B04]